MSPATSPALKRSGEPARPGHVREALHRALVVVGLISACGTPYRDPALPDGEAKPDGTGPDARAPDSAAPDAAAPNTPAPDAATADAARPDATQPCIPPSPGTAPTYTELYTSYFAPSTAGHCATDGCHAGDNYDVWLCGATPDSCYRGMLAEGLIDPANPAASRIADPRLSPLVWINPFGPMPRDGTRAFPPGGSATIARNQIIAWASACAQNN